MVTRKIIARGKAAHSGNHHQDGANAIWALARFLDCVARLGDVRIIAVAGGTSRNTVPDRAEATIELPAELLPSLLGALAERTSEIPGTSIEIQEEEKENHP